MIFLFEFNTTYPSAANQTNLPLNLTFRFSEPKKKCCCIACFKAIPVQLVYARQVNQTHYYGFCSTEMVSTTQQCGLAGYRLVGLRYERIYSDTLVFSGISNFFWYYNIKYIRRYTHMYNAYSECLAARKQLLRLFLTLRITVAAAAAGCSFSVAQHYDCFFRKMYNAYCC